MTSSWLQNTLTIDDDTFHYVRTGGNKPPLMLLHGFGDNGLCWTPIAEQLAANYDVIMPSARGHGRSQRFKPDEEIDLAADVAGIIKALQLPPVILLGHSMGAATAALTAAAYPALVHAIILSDPPWFSAAKKKATPDPPPRREDEFYIWLRDLQALSVAEVEAHCRQENPHWPEAEFAPWAQSKHQFDLNFFAYQPDWAWRPWQEYAHKLACPGLLLRADVAQGALVTAQTAQEVLGVWPHGRVAYIPHAGHSIRRDKPAAFMSAVQSFLSSLPTPAWDV